LIVIGVTGLAALVVMAIGLVLSRPTAPAPTATASPAPPAIAPTGSPTPTPAASGLLTATLAPPPALADLATQFPKLADVLNDPELNTVYKDFLVAYQQGGEQAAIDLARQRGILSPQNEIRATLILDSNYTEALVQQLKAQGVIVETAYEKQVDIAVPLTVIKNAIEADQPEAVFKQLTELEHVIRVKAPQRNFPGVGQDRSLAADVIGQGVSMIGADKWHTAGFTGAGVKVGILDCGFKDYQKLLGSELPDRVVAKTFVHGLSDPNDSDEKHGTAVAEIVHEIAPDAELFLADYGCQGGPTEGRAVEWLSAQGVQIISNSTGNPTAPMDGTGQAVALVKKAAQQGVLWINSSGNEALQHYRSRFTDTNNNQYHEFEGTQEALLFASGEPAVAIVLRWNDWDPVDQDLDLFLADKNGNILARSQNSQTGAPGDEPLEVIEYDGLTVGEIYHVAVYASKIDRPVLLDLYLEGDLEMTPVTAGYSLLTPADAREALAVGAVKWSTDQVTSYSSRGPTDDGRTKPDLVAPSEVDNVTYGHFGGTSAAAPHVAGAAALVWGANPGWDRQQVWDYLINNAVDYGPRGPDDEYGAGRLQLADPAAQAGPTLPPIALPSETPVPSDTPTPSLTPTQTPTAGITPSPTLPPSITPTASPTPGAAVTSSDQNLGVILMIGSGLVLLALVIIVIVRLRRRPASGLPRNPAPQVPPPYAPPSYPQGPGPGGPTPYMPTVVAPSAACPHCGKPVRVGAKFCAACGKTIAPAVPPPAPRPPGPTTQPPQPTPPPPPQVQVYCKNCRQPLRSGAKFCAKCGTRQ